MITCWFCGDGFGIRTRNDTVFMLLCQSDNIAVEHCDESPLNPLKFKGFCKMHKSNFNCWLHLVASQITKKDTILRA
jgi:hypothetical protein